MSTMPPTGIRTSSSVIVVSTSLPPPAEPSRLRLRRFCRSSRLRLRSRVRRLPPRRSSKSSPPPALPPPPVFWPWFWPWPPPDCRLPPSPAGRLPPSPAPPSRPRSRSRRLRCCSRRLGRGAPPSPPAGAPAVRGVGPPVGVGRGGGGGGRAPGVARVRRAVVRAGWADPAGSALADEPPFFS